MSGTIFDSPSWSGFYSIFSKETLDWVDKSYQLGQRRFTADTGLAAPSNNNDNHVYQYRHHLVVSAACALAELQLSAEDYAAWALSFTLLRGISDASWQYFYQRCLKGQPNDQIVSTYAADTSYMALAVWFGIIFALLLAIPSRMWSTKEECALHITVEVCIESLIFSFIATLAAPVFLTANLLVGVVMLLAALMMTSGTLAIRALTAVTLTPLSYALLPEPQSSESPPSGTTSEANADASASSSLPWICYSPLIVPTITINVLHHNEHFTKENYPIAYEYLVSIPTPSPSM